MLNITVNKDKIFDYKEEKGIKILNGKAIEADMVSMAGRHYHIIHRNASCSAEVLVWEEDTKTLTLRINGKICSVQIKDNDDLLLEKMGITSQSSARVKEVKAPMPGLILEIKAVEGSAVKTGDPLIVLEAMKMENVLRAPCDGVIQTVSIKKGSVVEKNQLLMKFKQE